jgi:hypothetical protein
MIKEEWQIQVGKNKHTISGEEKRIILNAGDVRFVSFRDLTINPAFVSDMVLIRTINDNQLEAPDEVKPTQEELERAEKVKQEIREKVKRF